MTLPALNRYGRLCAELYDLNLPVGSTADIDFYLDRLKDVAGPVLEAACGTGRLTLPLLAANIDVRGFDHSPDMLAIARANAAARGLSPVLIQARFQDFAYDTAFAAIIVPQSSFVHVDDFDEAMAVLERFRRHLRPGGLLLIDMASVTFFQAVWPTRTRLAANGDLLLQEGKMVESDPVAQRYVAHDRYERWRDGRLGETELERTAYRVWGWRELTLALAATGFTDIEVTTDFLSRAEPSLQSKMFNFAARAP